MVAGLVRPGAGKDDPCELLLLIIRGSVPGAGAATDGPEAPVAPPDRDWRAAAAAGAAQVSLMLLLHLQLQVPHIH